MLELVVEPLSRAHDREAFDCGQSPQNLFLKNLALQHAKQENRFSQTMVAVAPNTSGRILGYYTFSFVSVLPLVFELATGKNYPRTEVGCMLIGQLARDKDAPTGTGSKLLFNALDLAHNLDQQGRPLHAVLVDAQTKSLVPYYLELGLGFRVLEGQRLFLTLRDIHELFTG